MPGDPWTIVYLSIKAANKLRWIENCEIHFCFYIEQLTEFCLQKKLPVMTALVVKIKTELPGGYFYRLFDFYGVSEAGADKRTLHDALLKDVWDYQCWSILDKFFSIHEFILARLKEVVFVVR